MPIYKFKNPNTGQAVQVWADTKDMAVQKFQSETRDPKTFRIKDPRSDVSQNITAFDAKEAVKISQNMPSGGLGTQAIGGAVTGISNLVGLPVDLLTGLVVNPAAKALGLPQTDEPFMGSEMLKKGLEIPFFNIDTLKFENRPSEMPPQTGAERFARRGAEYGAGSLGFGGFRQLIPGLAAAFGEQTALELTDGDIPKWLQPIIGVASALVPAGLKAGASKGFQKFQGTNPYQVYSSEIRKEASNLYSRIRDNKNLAIDPTIFQGLENDAFNFAKQNGFTFIDDAGREVIKKDFEKTKEILSTLRARDRQNYVSGAQAMSDRQSIQNAIKGAEGPEKAMLSYVWRQYKNRIGSQLGPEFEMANELWRRSSNADKILTELNIAETAIDQGGDAYKLVQGRLRNLLNRIDKGYEPFFNEKEIQAIRDASKQTNLQSMGRFLQQFGFSGRGIVGMASGAALPGSAYALTGDLGTTALVAGLSTGASAAGRGMARGSQSARVNKMIEEVLANPKLGPETKDQLIRAIKTYAIQQAGGVAEGVESAVESIMP